ncbi:outer membrane homotrimeric porin [Megalodesulfovibrio paquesii]
MRRAFVLVLLCGCLLVLTPPRAQAVEVKVKGNFLFDWTYMDLGSMGADWSDTDHFGARQRIRLQMDFVASEALKGILMVEIGDILWGTATSSGRGSGGALGADGVNVETKRAFLQCVIPDTDLLFSVGIQGLAAPAVIAGSPFFDDDVAGVLAQYPVTGMVTVGAFWARPYNLATSGNPNPWDELDIFGLLVPVKGDGWKVHPYAILALAGRDVLLSSTLGSSSGAPELLAPALYSGRTGLSAGNLNQRTLGWWAGSTFLLDMFAPVTFKAEGVYGAVEAKEDAADRRGFYLAAELDYALECMTVGVMGWYASGEDASWRNGSEQMPSVSADWNPTTFAWDSGKLLSSDDILAGTAALNHNNPAGKWGVALLFKDISLVEDLTHQVRFLYASGTNDPKSRRVVYAMPNLFMVAPVDKGIELTSADRLFEVNLDSEYKLYENLGLILELGMVRLQYEDVFYAPENRGPGWKIAWGLNYTF